MNEPLHRYVALLRAINVGGHSIIKMDDLRKWFESMGFTNVVPYIQSGNVVFSTSQEDTRKLVRQIEAKLSSLVARESTVFVLNRTELQNAVRHNPFDPEKREAEQHCQLMFLSDEPDAAAQHSLMTLQGKEYKFFIHSKVFYYAYSRKFVGHRRMIDFEKVLGVTGTGRTWKVVNKLIEIMS